MTNNLTVEIKKNKEELGNEEIIVKSDIGDLIFVALRFGEKRYSSVFWQVDPMKTKEDYVRRLAKFYESMKDGTELFQIKRQLNGTLLFNYGRNHELASDKFKNPEEIPLEQLCGNEPQLFKHPNYKNFVLLRAFTPYCDFTMEDFSGNGWNPNTGRISVISHNDLSVSVSRLIAETSKYSAPADQLQPILAENVYTFK